VNDKRNAFKKWKPTRIDEEEESRQAEEQYRDLNKKAKEEVAKAKEKAYEQLYKDVEENGVKSSYKLAKTRKRRSLDLVRVKFVKDSEGEIVSECEEIKQRWWQYFSLLLNTKNKRKELEEAGKIEEPIAQITREEVKKQLEKMKNGKAAGPDDFSMEIVKKLGYLGLD